MAVAAPATPRDEAISALQVLLQREELQPEVRAELRLRLATLYEDQARATFQASEGADVGVTSLERAARQHLAILRDTPGWERADEASYGLATDLRIIGKAPEATQELRRFVRTYPQSRFQPDAWLLLGEDAFERDDLGQAYAAYQRAAAYAGFDKHDYAVYKLAWCQYDGGDVVEAIATMKSVVGGAMADEANRDLARMFADADQLDAAWAWYTKVGKLELYGLVADRAAEIGRTEKAILAWRQLLAADPNGAGAPALEAKIIGGLVTRGDEAAVLVELRRAVERYGLGSSWRLGHPGEDTIGPLVKAQALRWQANVKRLPTAPLAADAWSLYLGQYPQDADARYAYAELLYGTKRYEAAYEQYMAVVAADPGGERTRFCAESAVFAAQQGVTDQAGPADERLVAAVDQYHRLYPTDPKGRGMLYRAAYLLYSRDRLAEAEPRFRQVVALDPGSADAEQAAHLVLDIYTIRRDWAGLERVAHELVATPGLGAAAFDAEVLGIEQNAALKQVEAGEGSPAARARAYLAFVARWPEAEHADLALHDAAALFDQAGLVRDAIDARETLLQRFPRSAHAAGDQVALGFGLESVADFEGAAAAYERYAAVAKDARANDALRSAALFRDATGSPERAVADYRELLARSPKERGVRLEIGRILAERGDAEGARQAWLAVARDPGASVDEAMAARERLATGEREAREAIAWFAAHRGGATVAGIEAAGEVALRIARAEEARFVAIRLDAPPAGADADAWLAQAIRAKASALQAAEAAYGQVVDTGAGAAGVAALAGIGRIHEGMADAVAGSYVPPRLDADQAEIYRDELATRAWTIRAKALEAYRAAADRGHELGVLGDGAAESVRRLAALVPEERSATQEVLPAVAFAASGVVDAEFERGE